MTTETSSISEPRRSRRIFRSIGAVLAGVAVVIVLSTVTDGVLHAAGVFPAYSGKCSCAPVPTDDPNTHRGGVSTLNRISHERI